jgi:solute:Na+ symporter, SSS family
VTDAELVKYRYGGKAGNALRVFKGLYFGVLINCFVLGWIFKALLKVGAVMTSWNPWYILAFFVAVTMAYTISGGLSAVIMTDCVQFVIIICSAIVLAVYAVAHVGGLEAMCRGINQLHPGQHYLDFAPGTDGRALMPWSAFWVYILLQWWAHKYADGGGKLIQRMSAARNERHSVSGTFLYSVLYVLTTWPIILTALCALLIFPEVGDPEKLYPRLMTEILPNGVLGLCVVGLLSAFMSTVSTQLNLGASYLINDIYKAFFVRGASEKHYVLASRLATALMALTAMGLSVFITSIASMWQFVLAFASGAGVVWILRWFWWRINAWSEFSAMIVSGIVSSTLFCLKFEPTNILFFTVVATVPVFIVVTLLTPPVDDGTLRDFYTRVKPGQWGWRRLGDKYGVARDPFLKRAFVNFLLGTFLLLAINFGVGTLLLRSVWLGCGEILAGGVVAIILVRRILREDSLGEPKEGQPAARESEPAVQSASVAAK